MLRSVLIALAVLAAAAPPAGAFSVDGDVPPVLARLAAELSRAPITATVTRDTSGCSRDTVPRFACVSHDGRVIGFVPEAYETRHERHHVFAHEVGHVLDLRGVVTAQDRATFAALRGRWDPEQFAEAFAACYVGLDAERRRTRRERRRVVLDYGYRVTRSTHDRVCWLAAVIRARP